MIFFPQRAAVSSIDHQAGDSEVSNVNHSSNCYKCSSIWELQEARVILQTFKFHHDLTTKSDLGICFLANTQ